MMDCRMVDDLGIKMAHATVAYSVASSVNSR